MDGVEIKTILLALGISLAAFWLPLILAIGYFHAGH